MNLKRKFIRIAYLFTSVCIGILLVSCEKNGGENDLIEYVSKNIGVYDIVPINSGDIAIVNMGIIRAGAKESGFQVQLKEKANQDVVVKAKITNNSELIKAFDNLYKTNSPDFSEDLFELVEPEVVVKAGAAQSIDSIKIRLKNLASLPLRKSIYLIPIELETTTKGGELKSKLMFVRFKVDASNLMASVTGLAGESELNMMIIEGLENKVTLQVRLNQSVNKIVNVKFENEIDDELVADYNKMHDTSYLPFPKNSYTLTQSVELLENITVNNTDLSLELTDYTEFNPNNLYILPIQVSSSDAKGALPDAKKGIAHILVSFNNIAGGSTHQLEGEVIDRTSWTLQALSSGGFVVKNLIDGKNNTAWLSTVPNSEIKLNMGKLETVKGFEIVPNYSVDKFDFVELEVFSSMDGVIWTVVGRYIGTPRAIGSTALAPDIKVLKFNKPVSAQHFRFKVLKVPAGVGALTAFAELNAIK